MPRDKYDIQVHSEDERAQAGSKRMRVTAEEVLSWEPT
jgi:hypothetical protein